MTKLLTLGTLFSTAARAVVVANLLFLGNASSTSFILGLREALVAKLVISDILSSIFLILALYTSFLTTSVFTSSLNLLKSTGAGTNLSSSNLSTLLFKLFNLVRTFSNYQYLIYIHQILIS